MLGLKLNYVSKRGPVLFHDSETSQVVEIRRHDDVIKWKHFPRYWPFARGIHRSLVNSSYKGQWRGALMFSLIWVWMNSCVNRQPWGWWFETPSHPFWRHSNGEGMFEYFQSVKPWLSMTYHYDDVIMDKMASQITSLTIVYSAVYSGADQRKHQSSASLAFVRGIHRGPVNSPHKWPVTRKMFPFDDVIMIDVRGQSFGRYDLSGKDNILLPVHQGFNDIAATSMTTKIS